MRKGKSLCHGVAGNGYLMHSLSQMWTKYASEANYENKLAEKRAEVWKYRVKLFASILIDPFYQKQFSDY